MSKSNQSGFKAEREYKIRLNFNSISEAIRTLQDVVYELNQFKCLGVRLVRKPDAEYGSFTLVTHDRDVADKHYLRPLPVENEENAKDGNE